MRPPLEECTSVRRVRVRIVRRFAAPARRLHLSICMAMHILMGCSKGTTARELAESAMGHHSVTASAISVELMCSESLLSVAKRALRLFHMDVARFRPPARPRAQGVSMKSFEGLYWLLMPSSEAA